MIKHHYMRININLCFALQLWYRKLFISISDQSECSFQQCSGLRLMTKAMILHGTCTNPNGKSCAVWPSEPVWNAILQSSIIAGKVHEYLSWLYCVLASPEKQQGKAELRHTLLYYLVLDVRINTLVPYGSFDGHVEQRVDHGIP